MNSHCIYSHACRSSWAVRFFERRHCENAIKTRLQSDVPRFCTVAFFIIYYTHWKIPVPPTFGLPRLACSCPRFPGHQCIIQTNRYSSRKIFVRAGLCAHYYYIVCVNMCLVLCTRYTHYAYCIHGHFCHFHRPTWVDREDCPNRILIIAMIIDSIFILPRLLGKADEH